MRKDIIKVKYDVPFTAPPLLEFTANGYVVNVVEQRKDGFNIALSGKYDPPYTVKWRAQARNNRERGELNRHGSRSSIVAVI